MWTVSTISTRSTQVTGVDVVDVFYSPRYPQPVLDELTKFVLMQGEQLETRWLTEHQPDRIGYKCITCKTVSEGGRCMFNRAANNARDLRLIIERKTRE